MDPKPDVPLPDANPAYRIADDGSVLIRHEGSNLRCRFPNAPGNQEMACVPTGTDGLVCCQKPDLSGAELQGEQTSGPMNARLLMEVLDGQKRVASHLLPHDQTIGSSPKSTSDVELNAQGYQNSILSGGHQFSKGAGSPGLDIFKDNPLAMEGGPHKEDALVALEMRALGNPPPDDGAKPKQDDGKGVYTYGALRPFIIMSSSYLLFTITDGGIRTIILFHAHALGFTAMEVAIMFMAYEVAGVVTNLAAGVMGAKWGIKSTLLTGLILQIVGCGILMAWQDSWENEGEKWKAILFATMAQITVGVAKDLVKLGGKTVTKLVTPDEKQSMLFKLVSFITGWKNSLKGVGYFIGSAAVSFNYHFALGLMIFLILCALPWAVTGLTNDLGRTRKENLTLRNVFRQNYNITVLSISRFFLFASRDLWFEVPLPFFVRDVAFGLGWSNYFAGLTMGVFIIVYGQFQSWTPQLILSPLSQMPANKWVNVFWCCLLVLAPLYLGIVLQASGFHEARHTAGIVGTFITGLVLFALLFAVNSATHSYLIVRYAEGDKVALGVGFYYMANAAGRLVGTIVSGALYTFAGDNVAQGLAACFWASVAFVIMSAIVDMFARDDIGGLKLGALTLVPPPPEQEERLKQMGKKDMEAAE